MRTMTRRRIRGGRLRKSLSIGGCSICSSISIGRGVSFSVPLFRADTCWDERDVENYEIRLIHSFCRSLEPLRDVVLFTAVLILGHSRCWSVRELPVARVIAFEPNPDVAVSETQSLASSGFIASDHQSCQLLRRAPAGWKCRL
jgi:hypothetical protein